MVWPMTLPMKGSGRPAVARSLPKVCPQVVKTEPPRDAGELLRDLKIPIDGGFAVRRAELRDEYVVVRTGIPTSERFFDRRARRARKRNHDLAARLLLH